MKVEQSFQDQRILLLGGAGFLGSHLAGAFVKLGARVTVVDPCIEKTGGNPQNLSSIAAKINWLEFRVGDETDLVKLVAEHELVVDAMGLVSHHIGLAEPCLDLELNYLNHLALVTALCQAPRPVVYLGSRGQYGKIIGQAAEDYRQLPLDPQGVHKAAAESVFRIYGERFQFPCLSLRLGNCFGPRQLKEGGDVGLVGGFIRQLLAGQNVELYGSASRKRELLFAYHPEKTD